MESEFCEVCDGFGEVEDSKLGMYLPCSYCGGVITRNFKSRLDRAEKLFDKALLKAKEAVEEARQELDRLRRAS